MTEQEQIEQLRSENEQLKKDNKDLIDCLHRLFNYSYNLIEYIVADIKYKNDEDKDDDCSINGTD